LKEKGIVLNVTLPQKKLVRDLDRSALPRIFSDLLSNAAKYSDGDSSILLTKSGEIQQVWNWIS